MNRRFLCGQCAVILGLFILCYGSLKAKDSLTVGKSIFSQQVNSQYQKFHAEIMLPAQGYWRIVRTNSPGNITEIYLGFSKPLSGEQAGGRMAAVIEKEETRKGQYLLRQLHWPCTGYALKHNNKGPLSWQDLDAQEYKYVLESLSRSPWGKIEGQEIAGPFVFLVPGADFHFEKKKQYVSAKNKKILAWELRPYVDDGKHWVLYTDGSCRRQPLDTQLMKKYKQIIRPLKAQKKKTGKKIPNKQSYSIAAVCKKKPGIPLSVTLENVYTGKTLEIKWDMNKARQTEGTEAVDLKWIRMAAWFSYARLSRSPVLTTWLSTLGKRISKELISSRRRRQQETLSAFDILGGRAAVRETLQLQVLNTAANRNKEYTIALESLTGVQVKSHPFGDMLEKNSSKGEELPLANLVPHDCFMVYMANPGDILGFLDQGCSFLDRLGTTFTGNGIDYGLDKKYLWRLGLNRQWLRSLLKSGALKECALIFPDLFFIDGTDITVVSRLDKPGPVSSLLKLMGIELPPKSITSHKPGNDRTVYWSLWDDLLMVSTCKKELLKVLHLKTGNGRGSLGQSHEFRYMLTQLPVTKSTWSYVYFSDPFIRRLVSPAVKIGQLRRIRARADMEYLTSCALLAKLDGMKTPWSIKNLAAYDYIPDRYLEDDYYFDRDHILYSKTYGRLSNMKTLSQVPIDRVSKQEAKAYKRYVDIYSDYWRQFFDPVAVRLDETADGFLEAEIFILPLVNNSIYNSLRTLLKRKEDKTPLKIPKLSTDPVVLLSLNLGEQAWEGILKDAYKLLTRYIPIHPGIFDDFGPGLHLAVHDADPVIALGSGDILGVFNADIIGSPGRAGGEMLSIPVLLSIFTRPCTLIVESQNPRRTLGYLKQAVPYVRTGKARDELQVKFHQVENRDQWVFSFNLIGLIKLRYSVELQDEFVLIRNIPWSHDEKIIAVDKTALKSASLETYPEACHVQLPGLFKAAQDRSLLTAFQGVGHLFPLVASGYANIKEAAAKHAILFGFAPKHPGNGRFLWDNFHLKSSIYGSIFNQRQLAYKKGDSDFGLLKGFRYLGVSMQFEDTGLRTKFRWKITR